MDLVYSQAFVSIAILDSAVDLDVEMALIQPLTRWGHSRGGPSTFGYSSKDAELEVWENFDKTFSFLEMISRERWNSRAWVLQEAISAGEKMYLAFLRR